MYPLIDLLRACAATLVVAYHVILIGQWTEVPYTEPWRTFKAGWIGVDFFLVISGFVIALSAYRGWAEEPDNFRGHFLLRRLARIVPLYLLTCLIYLVFVDRTILGMAPGAQVVHYVSHLLFLHNLHPATHGSINGPTWSIALEMQFYVAMALAMPWMARQRWWVVAATLVITAVLYRYATTLWLVPGKADTNLQMVYTSELPGTLDQFGCGIVLALACVRPNAFARRWLVPGWLTFGVWAGLTAVLFVTAMAVFWPRAITWFFPSMIIYWKTLLSLAFASAIAAAITFPRPDLRVLKPFLYLGEISYGIYLWHMLVLTMVLRWFHLRGFALLACVFAITLALAAASWHWLEKPAMNWVRSRLARSQGAKRPMSHGA